MSRAMSNVGQKLLVWAGRLRYIETHHHTPGTLALCEQVIDNAVAEGVIESYTAELVDESTVTFTVKLKGAQP